MKKHRFYLWAIFVLESMQPKMRLLLYLNTVFHVIQPYHIDFNSFTDVFQCVFLIFNWEDLHCLSNNDFSKVNNTPKTNCVSYLEHGKTWFAIKFIHCRKNHIELFTKMIINVTCYFLQRENIMYLYYFNPLRTIVNYFL